MQTRISNQHRTLASQAKIVDFKQKRQSLRQGKDEDQTQMINKKRIAVLSGKIEHQQRKQSASKSLFAKRVLERQKVKEESELISKATRQAKSMLRSSNSFKVKEI